MYTLNTSDESMQSRPRLTSPSTRERMRISYNCQLAAIKCKIIVNKGTHKMSEDDAVSYALYPLGTDTDALVRYCIVRFQSWISDNPEPFLKLCKKWREEAAILYWQDHELLDEILMFIIPNELKDDAEEIYEEWCRRRFVGKKVSGPRIPKKRWGRHK